MTLGGLTWDTQGKHYYYTGIDAVALYVWDDNTGWYGKPVAWDGVTSVNESPSGAESNKLYADNIEYLNLLSKEEFGFTIECYQTPKDNGSIKGFDECDGIITRNHVKLRGQRRKQFGLVYRVQKGSDTVDAGGKVEGNTKGNGYIYHIVYGCKASPSSRDFATVNDSPEAQTFSYEVTTTALSDTSKFPGGSANPAFKAVAHIEIDATKLDVDTSTSEGHPIDGTIQALENLLFNASGNQAMPTPAEIAIAVGYTG